MSRLPGATVDYIPFVGDVVAIANPTPTYRGLYRVTNTGPKNATLDPVPGLGGKPCRAPYSLLRPATDEEQDKADAAKAQEPAVAPFKPGKVVRFKQPTAKTQGLFVVVAEGANGYRLYPVGGADRYFRNVKQRDLVGVSVGEFSDDE